MTKPAVKTVNVDFKRHYVHPITNDKVPSVTTILSAALAKPALVPWAAKIVAEYAVANKDTWQNLDNQAAIDLIKNSHRRISGEAMQLGSSVHTIIEDLLRNKPVDFIPPQTEHMVRKAAELIQEFRPKPSHIEVTVWSHKHNYAGSLDAVVEIAGKTYLFDWKTSSGVFPDYALQCAAYANADEIIRPDGEIEPLPVINGFIIAHLPKDPKERWSLVPMHITDKDFDGFLACKNVFDWQAERSKVVVGPSLGTLDSLTNYDLRRGGE